MKTIVGVALGALLMSLAGCPAAVGTTGAIYVPKDAAATCSSHCASIGLQLTSVVVMANNVGCVCSVNGTTAAGATAGGMAALLVQEQQEQQQSSSQSSSPN